MARDSRKVRQLRRLKRERTSLTRMLDHVLQERNMYRGILEEARKRYLDATVTEPKKNEVTEGEVLSDNRVVEVPVEGQGS